VTTAPLTYKSPDIIICDKKKIYIRKEKTFLKFTSLTRFRKMFKILHTRTFSIVACRVIVLITFKRFFFFVSYVKS